MVQNYNRSITYTCPSCGIASTRTLSPFVFSGRKSIAVLCPVCSIPCLVLHDRKIDYLVEIQCVICGDRHSSQFRKPDLWNNPLLTVDCDNTDISCCFIGDTDQIKEAFRKAQDKLAELESEEEEYFDDYIPEDGDESVGAVIASICEILHMMQYHEVLSCRCGRKNINITVIDDKICVRCNSCGSTKLFEPTDDLLDELYQAESFIFNKK